MASGFRIGGEAILGGLKGLGDLADTLEAIKKREKQEQLEQRIKDTFAKIEALEQRPTQEFVAEKFKGVPIPLTKAGQVSPPGEVPVSFFEGLDEPQVSPIRPEGAPGLQEVVEGEVPQEPLQAEAEAQLPFEFRRDLSLPEADAALAEFPTEAEIAQQEIDIEKDVVKELLKGGDFKNAALIGNMQGQRETRKAAIANNKLKNIIKLRNLEEKKRANLVREEQKNTRQVSFENIANLKLDFKVQKQREDSVIKRLELAMRPLLVQMRASVDSKERLNFLKQLVARMSSEKKKVSGFVNTHESKPTKVVTFSGKDWEIKRDEAIETWKKSIGGIVKNVKDSTEIDVGFGRGGPLLLGGVTFTEVVGQTISFHAPNKLGKVIKAFDDGVVEEAEKFAAGEKVSISGFSLSGTFDIKDLEKNLATLAPLEAKIRAATPEITLKRKPTTIKTLKPVSLSSAKVRVLKSDLFKAGFIASYGEEPKNEQQAVNIILRKERKARGDRTRAQSIFDTLIKGLAVETGITVSE